MNSSSRLLMSSAVLAIAIASPVHAQVAPAADPVAAPPAADPVAAPPAVDPVAAPPAAGPVASDPVAAPPPAASSSAETASNAGSTASNSDDGRSKDIVVTAQFRSQKLQDTPLAITAVNSALLESRGQTSIYQVAAQAPNVTLQPSGQSYGSGVVAFIRGIGQYDTSYALEPGVGIYVDDVYYSTLTGSLLELLDLDRVEVLRGPQGTLAGKNSIGGAIKLFSKKPTGDNSGMIQATYGSFNRTELRGFANFTVVPDKVFMRIAGAGKSEDGYVTRLDYGNTHPGSGVPTNSPGTNKLGTLGGTSYAAVRVALRWLATPDIEVNLAGDYTNDKSEAGAAISTYANYPYQKADGTPFLTSTTGAEIPFDCRFVPYGANSCDTLTGYNRKYVTYANFLDASTPIAQSPYKPFAADPINYLRSYGYQGTIDWRLADGVNLKSITAFRHYKNLFGTDEDGSPVPLTTQFYNQTHRQFSQEVRLNADLLDGKLQTTVGGFYFRARSVGQTRVDIAYTYLDFINGPDVVKSTSKAAFAQATLHITPALNLTGGLRYSVDDKTYAYQRHNPDGSDVLPCYPGYPFAPDQAPNCAIFGLNGASDTAKSKRLDYRLALDYRFSPELLAYAQVSTGFKGGGVNPYPYYGPGNPDNQVKPFSPEKLKTYEVGLKSDLLDRHLRINAAAFYNDYQDIALSLNACPPIPPSTTLSFPCAQPNNVGSAHVKGLELESQVYPVAGLSLDGSFSYLDFKYKKFNSPYVNVTFSDVTPYTPKYKWSAGIQYAHDFAAGTLTGRLDGSYQSRIYTDPHNTPTNRINSYFLANGRLSYATMDKNWQLALEVQNLLNKYYFRTLIESSYGISAEPGKPRTWAVTLRRSF